MDNESGLLYLLVEKFSDNGVKKALEYLDSINFDFAEYDQFLKLQEEVEKESNDTVCDIEKASFYTEKAFEKVYCHLSKCENWKNIGKLHGRMVYIWDAIMDIKKDSQKGSFNPMISYNTESIREMFNSNFKNLEESLSGFISDRNKPELSEFMEFNRKEKNGKMDKWLKKIKKYLK